MSGKSISNFVEQLIVAALAFRFSDADSDQPFVEITQYARAPRYSPFTQQATWSYLICVAAGKPYKWDYMYDPNGKTVNYRDFARWYLIKKDGRSWVFETMQCPSYKEYLPYCQTKTYSDGGKTKNYTYLQPYDNYRRCEYTDNTGYIIAPGWTYYTTPPEGFVHNAIQLEPIDDPKKKKAFFLDPNGRGGRQPAAASPPGPRRQPTPPSKSRNG